MTVAYRARDTLGQVLEGELEADSLDEAALRLRRDGLQVLHLEEADAGDLFPKRITRQDIIYVTSQLAVMVETGITLSAALAGILAQESNPGLKRLLADLKSSVEQGEDFSTALTRHPKHFDQTYVALVKASEATGTLGEMLQRIAGYLRKEVETRAKVRAALAYPTVMLLLAVVVTIFLLTYVLPKFTPLFTSRGTSLPKPTVVMMALSDALIHYWPLWLLAIAACCVGFVFGRRTEPGRKVLDGLKIHLPIAGTMFRKVALSRSIHTLGTMIASGVSMLDALRLSADVAGNYHYRQLWLAVLDHVTEGKQIHEALAGQPLFPPMLVQMIAAGEETGKLDEVLHRVSGFYDQEVETSLKTVTSLIEPIMITVMGVVVGGIGLALLLPIFSLSKTPG
jgi:type IV pilus assembly protein PilC